MEIYLFLFIISIEIANSPLSK
uniref:Uncharacterized protein n=1 Tax=Arundo donax TaxID=35708 RepID=A0A0A9F653_ARUDO